MDQVGEEGRRGLEWEERDQVGGEAVEGEGRGESEVRWEEGSVEGVSEVGRRDSRLDETD